MGDFTVVSPQEWLARRKEFLVREKELTRLRDEIAAERRRLPVVEVKKPYRFDGPDGPVSLADLFGRHRQLVVYHFMFDPDWEQGCAHCSHCADNFAGALPHLAARNTAFAVVSRAPLAKIEAFRKRMNWTFPWVSSFGSDFNYDFRVTIDPSAGSTDYNYETCEDFRGENSGLSCFLRQGGAIYHSYSTYARGLDTILNTYNILDLTPLGRQEGKSPDEYPQSWVRHRDRYAT